MNNTAYVNGMYCAVTAIIAALLALANVQFLNGPQAYGIYFVPMCCTLGALAYAIYIRYTKD